ncbi:MAG TPA: DUF4142 domain-containing protein [Longimicrobium sp.]|nr:DUF4142 domain-containing protein [Longimicrobium sp.]
MRRAMQGMVLAAAVAALPMGAAAQAAEASDQNDRAVHAFASAVDVGEVQQSMLAVERATNPEVRAYAQQMISDHSNALHTREMLMQTENSGLLPHMAHGQGDASTRSGGLPPAYGPGNAQVEVDQTKTQRAGGSVGAVGVAQQQGRNPGDPGDAGTREGALAPAHGAGNAQVEVDQTKTQRAGGSVGAVGVAQQGSGQGDAHAGHHGMQHGQGHAGMPQVTPEMVQQLQAALMGHPVSRPVMESNARNLQVLQGINGPQFDASYMDAQIGAHRYALQQIDRMLAQEGLGDDITQVMRGMRTAVAAHLQQAEQIRGRLR